MKARILVLVACLQLLLLHWAAFEQGGPAVVGALIYLASWGIFIVLCVKATRVNPKRRLPKAKKGDPASEACGPSCACAAAAPPSE